MGRGPRVDAMMLEALPVLPFAENPRPPAPTRFAQPCQGHVQLCPSLVPRLSNPTTDDFRQQSSIQTLFNPRTRFLTARVRLLWIRLPSIVSCNH